MSKICIKKENLSEALLSSLVDTSDLNNILREDDTYDPYIKLKFKCTCGTIIEKPLYKVISTNKILCKSCSRKEYYANHPEAREVISNKNRELWCNKEYREKQSSSRSSYYDNNPEAREVRRESFRKSMLNYHQEHPEASNLLSDRNKEPWFKELVSKGLQRHYQEHPEAKELISIRVKEKFNSNEEERYRLANYVADHPECIKRVYHSGFEEDVLNSLNLYDKYILNDRSALKPRELDIYIPDKNLAIKCNGNYWHSSPNRYFTIDGFIGKPYTYHYDKYKDCKISGIHLIQISESDWYSNRDKIVMYINDLLNCNKIRLYARNCSIKEINPNIAKDFYNTYHLQGSNLIFKYNYGLYFDEELISCMSFGKSRVRNTVNKEGYYELHRYCVKSGYTILGGAEKLFKQFIKDYNPIEIKSFSDNDYFSGNIYKRLGFTETDYVRVYYWWNTKGCILHREECQLKYLEKLFPESYTKALNLKCDNAISNREEYIMESEGYLMYVTSGRTKWVWSTSTKLLSTI